MSNDGENYFRSKIKRFDKSKFRLKEVTDLSVGNPPQILLELLVLYESGNFVEAAVASILNAIITAQKAVFTKSTDNLHDIIFNDPNHRNKRKDMSSDERGEILGILKDQFIREDRIGRSSPNIPAVWSVKDDKIMDYLCQVHGLSRTELLNFQGVPILNWREKVEKQFSQRPLVDDPEPTESTEPKKRSRFSRK